MRKNYAVVLRAIICLCAALVTACAVTPRHDTSTYPANWPRITKASGERCNSLLGTFVAGDDEIGTRDLLVVSRTLLRTEKGIADAKKLHISQSAWNKEFIEIDAYNGEAHIENSRVRVECKDGALYMWPQNTEERQGHPAGRPIYLDESAPNYWIYKVKTRVTGFHQANGYIIMSEAISECNREDFTSGYQGIHRKGMLTDCKKSTNWYRLKRI